MKGPVFPELHVAGGEWVVSPSISSTEKIATALGVTMGEFFAAAAQGEGGLIVRAAAEAVARVLIVSIRGGSTTESGGPEGA